MCDRKEIGRAMGKARAEGHAEGYAEGLAEGYEQYAEGLRDGREDGEAVAEQRRDRDINLGIKAAQIFDLNKTVRASTGPPVAQRRDRPSKAVSRRFPGVRV